MYLKFNLFVIHFLSIKRHIKLYLEYLYLKYYLKLTFNYFYMSFYSVNFYLSVLFLKTFSIKLRHLV